MAAGPPVQLGVVETNERHGGPDVAVVRPRVDRVQRTHSVVYAVGAPPGQLSTTGGVSPRWSTTPRRITASTPYKVSLVRPGPTM